MSSRHFSVLLVALLPLLFTACVQLEQTIELGSNNTGEFAINARIPSAAVEALDGKAALPWLSPKAGTAQFPAADGFRITRYRVYELDGFHHLKITGELTDAKKALAAGPLGNFVWTEAGDVGTIRLKVPPDYPKDSKQPDPRELRKLLKDFRITLNLKLPAAPTATTAHAKDGRTVTWTFDNTGNLDFAHQFPDVSAAYKK